MRAWSDRRHCFSRTMFEIQWRFTTSKWKRKQTDMLSCHKLTQHKAFTDSSVRGIERSGDTAFTFGTCEHTRFRAELNNRGIQRTYVQLEIYKTWNALRMRTNMNANFHLTLLMCFWLQRYVFQFGGKSRILMLKGRKSHTYIISNGFSTYCY